jgi:hypothetical protein
MKIRRFFVMTTPNRLINLKKEKGEIVIVIVIVILMKEQEMKLG